MTAVDEREPERGFRHEALLYATDAEFLDATTAFVRDGLALGEAALVVVDAPKVARLRAALGDDADGVLFADMETVGRNPALIIHAWREFVAAHRERAGGSRGARGIGEPISATRGESALVECQIHESLVNVAFADEPGFWLLCPYNVSSLSPGVIEIAVETHPFVIERDRPHPGGAGFVEQFGLTGPLPEPARTVESVAFDATSLRALRARAASRCFECGVDRARVPDFIVAVSEIATNAIVHGDGRGETRFWLDADHLVCEVRGGGHVRDPLVGRIRPAAGQMNGYGVWLANQACDLVQIRSGEHGTTVRLHINRG